MIITTDFYTEFGIYFKGWKIFQIVFLRFNRERIGPLLLLLLLLLVGLF